MGAEQSNTSIVLDERLALKVFRRIEPGINPELEMLRFLAAHGFTNIAALAGWCGYDGRADGRDARRRAALRRPARATAGSSRSTRWTPRTRVLPRPPRRARRGHRRACTPCSPPTADDPDFAPEEPTVETLALLHRDDRRADRADSSIELPDAAGARADRRARRGAARPLCSRSRTSASRGRLIRMHGDYHLGQTRARPAAAGSSLDFEGEPARPLLERRRKRSPLRDVAGMLRSFAYAASAARARCAARACPTDWEAQAREQLPRRLHGVGRSGRSCPTGEAAIDKLLAIFELEKAIYELRYELDNRPDWVAVPVAVRSRGCSTAHGVLIAPRVPGCPRCR